MNILEQIQNTVTTAKEDDNVILKAYGELVQIEKAAKAASTQLKEGAIEKACDYNIESEALELDGFKFSFVKSKRSYDYKAIPAWVTAKAELDRIQDLAKMAANNEAEVFDKKTGENIAPAVVKHSAEGLSAAILK